MTFQTSQLLILFLLAISPVFSFDPSEVNYCEKSCNGVEHTACGCRRVHSPRIIHTDRMFEFRQRILLIHNYWRNHVASGESGRTYEPVKTASNMLIMNYDLELEYFATCLAAKFDEVADNCRNTKNGEPTGQNLMGKNTRNLSVIEMVSNWYDEIASIKSEEDLSRYPSPSTNAGIISHFAQLVWAKANLVGCARVWNPKAKNRYWRYTLVCDYGSTSGSGSAVLGEPVYLQGEPCTACPFNTRCETRLFPALCGKSVEPPDTPAFLSASDLTLSPVLLVACILYIFYCIKLSI